MIKANHLILVLILVLAFGLIIHTVSAHPEITFDCSPVTEIPQPECVALVALYNSTNGDSWTNHTNWLETTTPSNWYGVTVASEHVYHLILSFNNLVGTIPTEIGNLTAITEIDISHNQLSGSIPAALGDLSNLEYLALVANQLTGPIPADLGNLTSLISLALNNNQLSGQVPEELGYLPALTGLGLSQNPNLTGPLPMSLTNLALNSFAYNNTNLCEPNDLNFFTWLKSIPLLSRTGVVCGIGFSCDAVFQIPKTECEALVALYNSTNGPGWINNTNWLVTVIPKDWYGLWIPDENVLSIGLDHNQLAGSLPAELGNLIYLDQMTMSDNQLSGDIPVELFDLPDLRILMLGNNQLSGSIPPEVGGSTRISYLGLEENQLSGNIPPELGQATNLSLLFLDENQLTGGIPSELGNLTNLTYGLLLNDNNLSGPIPHELGSLTNLQELRLNDNFLTGDVPETFVSLTKLYNPGSAPDGGDGLDLDYNCLNVPADYPNSLEPLDLFLNLKDPDWHLRQCIAQDIYLPVINR